MGRRAAVLPDDCVADWLAGGAVPQDRGFALVRDRDGVDIRGPQTGLSKHSGGHRMLRAPDLVRVVLNPARPRKNLPEFLLHHTGHLACTVKKYGA